MCWSRVDRSYDSQTYDARHSTHRAPEDAVPAGDFRVSDADRQQVVDQLRHHTGAGRLSLDEFESRLDEVMQAKTGNDLQNTLRELPPLSPPRRRTANRPLPSIPLPLLILGILLVVSATAGHPVFWLIIPIAFFCTAGRRRHHPRPIRAGG
jgi:hypothetical protein